MLPETDTLPEGNIFRQKRLSLNLTLQDVCDDTGITTMTLSRIETKIHYGATFKHVMILIDYYHLHLGNVLNAYNILPQPNSYLKGSLVLSALITLHLQVSEEVREELEIAVEEMFKTFIDTHNVVLW